MDYTFGDYECDLKQDGTLAILRYTGNAQAPEIPSEPDGKRVTEIGDYAFVDSALTAVTVPAGIEKMGVNPFSGCKKLSEVKSENARFTVMNGALVDTVAQILIAYPMAAAAECCDVPQGIRAIGESAFAQCERLRSVTLPNGLREIGIAAFCGCANLTEMTVPSGVKTIGESAFEECYGLTAVSLPDGLETIGRRAFECCGMIGEIIVPESVKTIGPWAFSYCDRLNAVTLPCGEVDIADDAFGDIGSCCLFRVKRGSPAARYAEESGYECEYR